MSLAGSVISPDIYSFRRYMKPQCSLNYQHTVWVGISDGGQRGSVHLTRRLSVDVNHRLCAKNFDRPHQKKCQNCPLWILCWKILAQRVKLVSMIRQYWSTLQIQLMKQDARSKKKWWKGDKDMMQAVIGGWLGRASNRPFEIMRHISSEKKGWSYKRRDLFTKVELSASLCYI